MISKDCENLNILRVKYQLYQVNKNSFIYTKKCQCHNPNYLLQITYT